MDPIDQKNQGSGTPQASGSGSSKGEGSGSPAPQGGTQGEPDPALDNVTIKDGFAMLPESTYRDLVSDMFKYKRKMKETGEKFDLLSTKVSTMEAEREKENEKKLEENNQFKELAEKREKENIDLQARLNQTLIDNELKVLALKEGINDIDGLKLADTSSIKIDPDSGKISGTIEVIENLKKEKEYLFQKPETAPNVDQGKPGKVPTTPITKKDLLYDAKLCRELKEKDPDRYDRIMKKGSG